MKRVLAVISMAALVMCFSGCSSMEVAKKTNGVGMTANGYTPAIAHLTYTNYGFYFLNWIPVLTGSVSNPDAFALFTDTVNTETAVLETTRVAINLGGSKVINLSTSTKSEYNVLSLFFWTREVQVSATVLE